MLEQGIDDREAQRTQTSTAAFIRDLEADLERAEEERKRGSGARVMRRRFS